MGSRHSCEVQIRKVIDSTRCRLSLRLGRNVPQFGRRKTYTRQSETNWLVWCVFRMKERRFFSSGNFGECPKSKLISGLALSKLFMQCPYADLIILDPTPLWLRKWKLKLQEFIFFLLYYFLNLTGSSGDVHGNVLKLDSFFPGLPTP